MQYIACFERSYSQKNTVTRELKFQLSSLYISIKKGNMSLSTNNVVFALRYIMIFCNNRQ